jgi:hypothetical protein
MMVVQVTTSWNGIFLNILQAPSMLPHFAYMSTKLLHTKTFEFHSHSMICLWTHSPSSSATMLVHAFNTPTKIIELVTHLLVVFVAIVSMFCAFIHISHVPNIMVVTTLTLGLWLKQTHGKVWFESVTQESHLHSHECEGMNPHTPKWVPISGIGIPMESQIFKKVFQGSKLIGLKNSLYHWKDLET